MSKRQNEGRSVVDVVVGGELGTLTLALSKGRILDETIPLLEQAGIEFLENPHKSRKLIFETTHAEVRIVVIRATDVPTFVEHGAADFGVAGKDVLVEHGANALYEPLDLKIASCKLMVAEREAMVSSAFSHDASRRIKVATKFVNITKRYFASQGKQVDIIKLYGSMELAPLVGLADCIVDVVDTGKTLKANGLKPTELIMPVSSRLVVNRASMAQKHVSINKIIHKLRDAVAKAAE